MRIHDFKVAFWNLIINDYEAFACFFVRANVLTMETKSKWMHEQGPEEFETFKLAQFANWKTR